MSQYLKFYTEKKWLFGLPVGILLFCYLLGVYWSWAPARFDVKAVSQQKAEALQVSPKVGFTTTSTLIHVAETLLNKSGGFLSNDKFPVSALLDDMPAWEFGVLVQVRDLTLIMRKDMSRSQSQSAEDKDLTIAQPQFNLDHRRWMFPSAEGEYQKGIDLVNSYLSRLSDPTQQDAQFYARADNLQEWLKEVENRLGSLSQRLSASVGQARLNTDLAGDAEARQSTPTQTDIQVKTSWWEIDDVFYEARGATWALIHFLKAVEVDFASVLEKKNATVSLRQIIRELEATQDTVWSPWILNGTGFGMVANHSLVMANYISRANAAVIDLNRLLSQG